MSKIAIIGFGYVGKAMFNFFKDHYNMVVFDPHIDFYSSNEMFQYDKDKIIFENRDISVTKDCELAIICVPTPRQDDGSCDLSFVEDVIQKIDSNLIIIKSTVDVGTTERLIKETGKNIIFSPEFCGESSYWTEYKWHKEVIESPWFIFGGDPKFTSMAVYYYMKVGGPTKKYMQTDSKTAEMTKYVENCFYATKITFCYEIANICEKIGIDYNKVRELWTLDPRFNPMHTAVFKENERPFSGHCFPKDLSALVSASKNMGYDAKLLEEVLSSNERIGKYRKNNQ